MLPSYALTSYERLLEVASLDRDMRFGRRIALLRPMTDLSCLEGHFYHWSMTKKE